MRKDIGCTLFAMWATGYAVPSGAVGTGLQYRGRLRCLWRSTRSEPQVVVVSGARWHLEGGIRMNPRAKNNQSGYQTATRGRFPSTRTARPDQVARRTRTSSWCEATQARRGYLIRDGGLLVLRAGSNRCLFCRQPAFRFFNLNFVAV